jgi:hypothetical protein
LERAVPEQMEANPMVQTVVTVFSQLLHQPAVAVVVTVFRQMVVALR